MFTVENVVLSTVQDFVRDGVLFTALDVSNKVKESLPLARHREVRDLVRAAFTTDIEPASYAKTPITVTLADGTTAEALLYHPLTDSWDLDAKYDAQKRAQTAAQPGVHVQAPALTNVVSDLVTLSDLVALTDVIKQMDTLSNLGPGTTDMINSLNKLTNPVSPLTDAINRLDKITSSCKSSTDSVKTLTDVTKNMSPSRVLWDSLFKAQPSLFPVK